MIRYCDREMGEWYVKAFLPNPSPVMKPQPCYETDCMGDKLIKVIIFVSPAQPKNQM